MAISREVRNVSDSQRDASRYHRLLLGLDHATHEIRRMEQGEHPHIDQILARLLPDLAGALGAEQAFVAVLREDADIHDKWFELTVVHPHRDLVGQRLPYGGVLGQLVGDGKPRVVNAFEDQSTLVAGLEILEATCAVVVQLRTASQVRVVGVCNKGNTELRPFLATDRMALDFMVELVAIGARAGERRSRELREIQKTSAAIGAQLDLNELLPLIARQAADVFDAPAISLMLWDEAEENLVIRANWGLSEEYVGQQQVPKARIQAILASPGGLRPIVQPNLRQDPFGQPDLIEREGLYSVLATPLTVSDKLIGVLNVYSKGKPRQFSSDEIELTEILANQAAMAIQNARLRKRELSSLKMTSAAIVGTLDSDKLLPLIIDEASQVFDAPATSLMLWDEARENLVIKASCGLSDDYVRRQRLPRSAVRAAAIQAEGPRPTVIQDVLVVGVGLPDLYEQERIRTVLSAPLVVSHQLVGVLNIYSKEQPRCFIPDEIELAAIFANQAAIAIENARLFSTSEEFREYLDGLVASSFDAVIAIDQSDHITVFNRQAERMLGYADEEMRGRSVARLHRDVEEARKIHDMVSQGGAVLGYETRLKDKEGRQIPVSLSAISIKDAGGNEIGQAGFMRDLRHIRSLEDRLHALVEMGQIIGGTLDLEEVYDLVVQAAVAAFPAAQKGALHLYDVETGLLRIKASVGYPAEIVEKVALKVGEGRAGWVYKHAAPLNVGNVQMHELTKRFDYPQEFEQKSTLCVPIVLRHQPIGVLSVDSVTEYDAFEPADLGILSTLANQAASAIENARLYGTARRRMEELERLRTVGQTIVERVTERPKEVLEQIAVGACRVIGADSAVIYPYLVGTGTYDVENIGSHGLNVQKGFDAAKRRSELTSVSGIVLKEKMVVVDDVPSRVDRSGGLPIRVEPGSFLDREGVMSFVGISLVIGEEPLGVLFVNFKAPHHFADDELSLVSILANQAAVAIQQARLFEQVKQELERQKKERAATHAVARLLGSVLDLKTVWEEILGGALRITQARRGQILLWDKRQGRLDLAVCQGITQEEQSRLQARLAQDDGLIDWVIRHPKALLVEDLPHDPAGDWYAPTHPAIRSVLIAPILQERFLIGVIILESRRLRLFRQDDRRLVESLAVYAGVAVYNAMQYAEIKQNAVLREGMLKAGQGITALKKPQEVLQAIADSVREALACDVVTLYTYDQDSSEIGFPAVFAGELRNPGSLQELKNIDKESVVGQLVASGRPHFADDSINDPMMTAGSFVEKEEIRSSAGIPLRVGDETLGILFVNYHMVHPFAVQERAEIELFATQAAIAIYNAQLYDDLQRRIRHQEALYEASKAITAGFSLERKHVLDSIVEQAVERVTGVHGRKATWGVIQLYDEVSNELTFESVYPQEELTLLKAKLGERRSLDRARAPNGRIGMTGRVVLERKPQLARDVTSDPDYVRYDATTRSELDVPLLDGDKVVGVLSVESDEEAAFDKEDEQAFMGLAELAVIAIKNADQAQRLSRTNAFAVMGAWGAEIAHEVNREVGNIRWQVASARRRVDSPQRIAQCLDMIDTCAGRLGLPALPEEAPKPGQVIEFIDASLVDEVVRAVIEVVQQEPELWTTVRIEADLHCEGIRVAMHPHWLSRLIQHLVRNAARFTALRGTGNRVQVRTAVRDTFAEVAVQDMGPGVPFDQVPLLFNQPVSHRDGTVGRGLLVVSYIASIHGGSARLVWNRVGEGACFAFSVPVARLVG